MRRTTQFTRQDGAVLLILILLVLNLALVGESGRERAKRAVCLANLRQLTLAWNLYAEDNDGKIVNGDTQEYTSMYRPEMPPQVSHYEELPWVLRDWMMTATVEQKEQAIREGALYPYTRDVRLYRCPVAGPAATRGYAIVDSMNCKGWHPGVMVKNKSQIERPSERFVFIDQGGDAYNMMGGWTCYVNEGRWWDPPPVYHNDGTNFSFADGHVEYWKWTDPRTVEFGRKRMAGSEPQPDNDDIRRTQIATWGDVARR